MKRIILLVTVSILLFSSLAQSQVNPNAIGLRLSSGNSGYGSEISYQRRLSESNRLELDFGFRLNESVYLNYLFVTVVYQWVWNITNGLNWYVGPGGQLGLFNNGIALSAGGQLGLEFDFNKLDVPLILSLDTRPMLRFMSFTTFGYGGAFALRYTF